MIERMRPRAVPQRRDQILQAAAPTVHFRRQGRGIVRIGHHPLRRHRRYPRNTETEGERERGSFDVALDAAVERQLQTPRPQTTLEPGRAGR